MIARLSLILLLLLSLPLSARAEPASGVPADSVTRQRFKIGRGTEANFTVTAGTLPIGAPDRDQQPAMFYTAYTRDVVARDARPLTFVFNGGPGASSAYLHVAAIGPRVVEFGLGGQMPPQPVHLVDNPDSWLDLTDLVFIDPIGTGYSTTNDAGKKYYAVREDLNALASFIDLYLARNNRMASPKYLVSESYGGIRAARLPQMLADDHGISLMGVIMISPVLEFSLLGGSEFEPLPFALRLPSYAASKIERTAKLTPEALGEVERFAVGPYLAALVASPRDPAATKQVNAEVSRFTGLPEELIARHNGLITPYVFVKEFRRSEQRVVSHYDASVDGPDPSPSTNEARVDPINQGIVPALTAAMNEQLKDKLGVATSQSYRVSNGDILRQWNWGGNSRNGYLGGANALRDALAANPQLKVMVAHGMTDLVTPYMASRFALDRLPSALTKGRVTLSLYAGGHMMYLRPLSRAKLHADAARLYPVPPH